MSPHSCYRCLFWIQVSALHWLDSVYRITSVADPDPYVFGSPGSGSISTWYGSVSGFGSGSFYHQAKIVRKTLIPTVLWSHIHGLKKALDPGCRVRIRNTASNTERLPFIGWHNFIENPPNYFRKLNTDTRRSQSFPFTISLTYLYLKLVRKKMQFYKVEWVVHWYSVSLYVIFAPSNLFNGSAFCSYRST